MTRKLINLRLPPELVARVDARAGELGQTRTKFVERALEKALRGAGTGLAPDARAGNSPPREAEDGPPRPARAPAASSRALSSAHAKRDVKPRPKKPK